MKKLMMALLAPMLFLLASPALAANCSPFTYTLTNGTLADANQVMSNFNNLLNCSNNNLANAPINTNLTQITGLTTPLTVSQGGTGSATAPGALTSLGALPIVGGTLTGELVTNASATGNAGFNLPQGAAPTSPVNGDLWTTSVGVFARINGVTTGLGSGSFTVLEFSSANLNATTNATSYFGNANLSTALQTYSVRLPVGGTVSQLYADAPGSPGGSGTYAYTVYQNGNPTTITCTMVSTARACNDTTHSFVGAAGDQIDIQIVVASSGAARAHVATLKMTP